MNRLREVMLLFMCTVIFFGIISEASGEWILSTGIQVNQVKDDLAPTTKGTEFTYPFAVRYASGNRFSLSFEGGYSSARSDLRDGTSAEFGSLTDTLFTANYTFLESPVILSGGLSVNMPTGKERLTQKEEQATIGERNDLFAIETFGEGLNVGVSLSLMNSFGQFGVGVNGLYVYKGDYDPTKEFTGDDLDPGDQLLIAGLLTWQPSPTVTVVTLTTYSYFGEDRVNGEKNFQEGSTFTVGGCVNYLHQPFEFVLSGQGIVPRKDRELSGGKLQQEPANSGSNSLVSAFDVMYAFSPALKFQATAEIRYYAESDRKDSANGRPYAGKRVRYSIGPGITYAVSKRLSCSLMTKYILMHEEKDLYLQQARTFQGVHINAGLSYTF